MTHQIEKFKEWKALNNKQFKVSFTDEQGPAIVERVCDGVMFMVGETIKLGKDEKNIFQIYNFCFDCIVIYLLSMDDSVSPPRWSNPNKFELFYEEINAAVKIY